MKPRVLRTHKILAVALTAAAGCTRVASVDAGPEITAPDAQPAAAAVIPQAPTPPVVDPATEPPALVALRDELGAHTFNTALAATAHFRPLCDKDGYPLVGNAARKDVLSVSTFCGEVRRRGAR